MGRRTLLGVASIALLAGVWGPGATFAQDPDALGQRTDPAAAERREAARHLVIAREALAASGRGTAFPPAKAPDESLANWALKWVNITEGVPAGATDNSFLFVEGRPLSRAYPRIQVDVRAEYAAPVLGQPQSPYRSQFYRLSMDCQQSTVRLTAMASFTGNGLQGEVDIEPDPPLLTSAIATGSPMWMIETQACPMARGEPPPGFHH